MQNMIQYCIKLTLNRVLRTVFGYTQDFNSSLMAIFVITNKIGRT